jgi:N-ethylmaleimide reductase
MDHEIQTVSSLWMKPLTMGKLVIRNRLIMAPLTRMRALEGDVPNPLAITYYAQRADAGLIITEATQITPLGKGYPSTPGIYSKAQVDAWKKIVDAVHAKDSKIVLQLWHVGRISHSSLHPAEGLPWAPSAIAPVGTTLTADWKSVPYEVPHAMNQDDIALLIHQYKVAAQNALEAGFDGVEIHSANGYLLDQFLQDGSNQRHDEYGGSFENRSRLLFAIINTVAEIYPYGKIGVRLSPYGTFNDMHDQHPLDLFTNVIKALDKMELAYLHLIEPRASSSGGNDTAVSEVPLTAPLFRQYYKGALISAGGYTKELAEHALRSNHADAIAFGRYFISNPDLLTRLIHDYPLAAYNRATFYGGDERGYTDYPSYSLPTLS